MFSRVSYIGLWNFTKNIINDTVLKKVLIRHWQKKMHNNYIPSTCSFTLCMYNPTNGINIHSKFDEQNQITSTKFHVSTNPQKVTFYDLNIIKVKRPGTAKIFVFLFSIVLKCWIALSEGSNLFCLKQKNMWGFVYQSSSWFSFVCEQPSKSHLVTM